MEFSIAEKTEELTRGQIRYMDAEQFRFGFNVGALQAFLTVAAIVCFALAIKATREGNWSGKKRKWPPS